MSPTENPKYIFFQSQLEDLSSPQMVWTSL